MSTEDVSKVYFEVERVAFSLGFKNSFDEKVRKQALTCISDILSKHTGANTPELLTKN